ncbi:MAG: hypothetical protein U1D35_15515 [Paracoccaceae bacterium]|nr:hypothetical protein [Paracoccaceae bacterium]
MSHAQNPQNLRLMPFLIQILAAGITGELVFEFLALVVAPVLLGTMMIPAGLVAGLGTVLFGVKMPMAAAWALHLFAGIALFPLGYVLFCRITGLSGWMLSGALWAVVLWVFAQGALAPMVGRPFMLGFVPYTWASLVVHLAYALTVAGALNWMTSRAPQS